MPPPLIAIASAKPTAKQTHTNAKTNLTEILERVIKPPRVH